LNLGLEEKVRQRTEELRLAHEKVVTANERLELHNRFIRSTFGRYVSDEVVSSLLESPTGLNLGGERRKVTILMSDLRGFTSLAEQLAPEQVLTIVNRYLGTMVDVILHYQGTINEFIGDAILVLFGAPFSREDDAQRAVGCAVAMQLAMTAVNAQNARDGLPAVEMGIGIHTGEVVIGNIGSHRRMKYGVVGSPANLASRVESYTVGGQILISEAMRQEVGPILRIGQRIEVEAKGIGQALSLYDVRGIGGQYQLVLPGKKEKLFLLSQEIPLRYTVVEGKYLGRTVFEGSFVRLSTQGGEIRSDHALPLLSNIKIRLVDLNGEEFPGDLYGKVVDLRQQNGRTGFFVRFTSLPSDQSLLKLLRYRKFLKSQVPAEGELPRI
jgi:adenylate cyclase